MAIATMPPSAPACAVCGASMARERALSPTFVVCRCPACDFVGLDLDAWQPPYREADYYAGAELRIDPSQPMPRDRAQRILRYATGGRAVDLGCGLGETALNLQRAGFDAWGVDDSPIAIERLRSEHPEVHWRCAGIGDFLADCGEFDVATLYHVLEHVPRPAGLVRALARVVRPGGLLVVEVPNLGGLQARLHGYRWEYWLDHHVNYFTPATLSRLIEPAGFAPLGHEFKYHFNWPQGRPARDLPHRVLCALGFKNIVTTYWRRVAR